MGYKINNNGRKVKTYLYKGEHLALSELSVKYGIGYATLKHRVRRNPDKKIDELMHVPGDKNHYRKGTKFYTYKGVTKSCAEWARHLGFGLPTMRERFTKWSVARAIETPLENGSDSKKASGWNKPLKKEVDYLEVRNRIKSYRKLGWPDDEIFVKISTGDFQHERDIGVLGRAR